MVLREEYVQEVKEEYEEAYLQCEPYSFYAFRCLVSNLRVMRDIEKHQLKLREHESIDDLCLYVSFHSTPPEEVTFPVIFNQVRVFYRHFGNV